MRIRNLRGGMATYPPGASLSPRVMRDFEFVWIIRGDAVWLANRVEHAALPGSIILSQPGFTDGYRWDPDHPTRHAYFHFELADAGKELPARSKWPLVRQMPDGDILRPLFGYIVANLPTGSRIPVAVERAIETLLVAFVAGPLGTQPQEMQQIPDPVHRAIHFAATTLARNPAAAITLEDLADAGAVTPKHLCRLFRDHVDRTPMEAVLAFRLHHALELMARTDLKLEAIARECGFATAFHFSRRFRDLYGKPPSAVRADLISGRHPVPTFQRWQNLTIAFPTEPRA